MNQQNRNTNIGSLYILLSALAFSLMGVLIKSLAELATEEQIVFFRNFFSLIILAPIFLKNIRKTFSTTALNYHLLRGLAGITSMYCYFYALTNMPIANAVLLSYSAPLFTPIIAYLWIKERTSWYSVLLIAIGLLGVMLVLKPGVTVFTKASVVALASGFFAAIAMVSIRKMSATEPAIRIVFFFSLIATVISAIPLFWYWSPLESLTWAKLIIIGTVATIGQYALTKGYSLATVAKAGPFTYMTVVFAGVFGWLLWDELPDGYSFFGAALVILAGVLNTNAGQTAPSQKNGK